MLKGSKSIPRRSKILYSSSGKVRGHQTKWISLPGVKVSWFRSSSRKKDHLRGAQELKFIFCLRRFPFCRNVWAKSSVAAVSWTILHIKTALRCLEWHFDEHTVGLIYNTLVMRLNSHLLSYSMHWSSQILLYNKMGTNEAMCSLSVSLVFT